MTALIRRRAMGDESRGRWTGPWRRLDQSEITRTKGACTSIPGKAGVRAGNLLNRVSAAPRPDLAWVNDFTCVRAWAGGVHLALFLDTYGNRLAPWHAEPAKHIDLMMMPPLMVLWLCEGRTAARSVLGSFDTTPVWRLRLRASIRLNYPRGRYHREC